MSIKLLDTIYKLTDNADKVDGKHASDFATSGHTHSYLPLSGGTIAGTLNIKRDAAAICYQNSSGTTLGWLGITSSGVGTLWESDGSTKRTLLHSGNSSVSKSGETLTVKINGTTQSLTNTNTTYSAGTGLSLSGTTFSNSGVRSISTGSANGTISVNTNGTSANVAVKGLGSAAYTASTAYAAASHSHSNHLSLAAYSFSSGCLVKTDIPTASNTMITFRIEGNSYGSKTILTTGHFYNYTDNNQILSADATNHGYSFGDISVFCYSNNVYLWFKQQSNYQSFIVYVYSSNYGTSGLNRAVSISNSAIPSSGVTRKVVITPKVSLDSSNWSSYCAPASHTHSYLPLSGGTMTGNIKVYTDGDGRGLKFGTSTLNSLSNQLLWQSAEAIRFGSSSWDWNAWAGLKYNHSSKIIYLGLADGTIFNANSAQSGGKLYTPGISNIYIGNGSYTVLHSNNWSTYCAAASHTHSYAASSHTHNYAGSNSAGGKAYDLYAHSGNPGSSNGVGVRWYTMSSTSSGSAGYAGTNAGFPVNNNANGMLWLGNHSGPYGGQLGISSNGRLYYRFISNGSFSTSANGGSWNRIAWTGDIPSSLKCPNSLTIQANGTSLGSYDGSAAKTFNITYSNVGAAAASHTHSYIPLSGGTLSSGTSRISRAGSSVSWYQGRANAMMYISSYSGYNAIASMKTTNGDWSMGVYSDNKMYFTYVQDTHYNSSTNTTTAQIVFQPNGYIVGNLSGYATSAGNADTVDGKHASDFAAKSHTHSYAASSHTHKYAGSSSAGGAATSANKLNTNAGSATKPVYFSGGVPVQVTGCMVQYWAIYEVYFSPSGTSGSTITKKAGNHNFCSSISSREALGQIIVNTSYPSGFNESTTMIFGVGDHAENSHIDSVYITVNKQYGSGTQMRLILADDDRQNWGYAYLYFLCIS